MIETLGTKKALEAYMTKAFFQAYEYQGFDVVKFRDNFMKLCSYSLDDSHTVWDGEKMVEVHGSANFVRLVAYLVSLFNLRGNNIDKIIEGINDKMGKAALKNIKDTLGIKPKVTEKGKARKAKNQTANIEVVAGK